MICDHYEPIFGHCKNSVARAPRLVVPSQTPQLIGHRAFKRFTTLHYCELHKGELKAEHLLTARLKRELEADARAERPLGFKCDFEKAGIDYVLCTTPEYREFLRRLGSDGIMRNALGTLRLAT
jgi:hypothetical protein